MDNTNQQELILDSVRKTYGSRRVLRDISLTAHGSEVVAVTGANGSGKSTLLKIVAGLLRPTQGSVRLRSGATESVEGAARRRQIGYAAPNLVFYAELTGRENLEFFVRVSGRNFTKTSIDSRLERVGLAARGDDRVAVYSSGMRQRLRLAFATLFEPELLLLDEPSLALDAGGVLLVAEVIAAQRARGGITLLATNDSREASMGDRTVALAG